MEQLIVQKYGGTSLAIPEKIIGVAKKIVLCRKKGYKMVVVVSALGNTTDKLLKLASKINQSPSEREIDMLISTGEQASSALLAMALHRMSVPAISFTAHQVGIITDRTHTKARIMKINTDKIKNELKREKIVIVAGFQGVDLGQEITTLGRGGSDLTAVALAKALNAKLCEIYTDVEGVYTADPEIVSSARKLLYISYEEMLELASLGAQVLQARSVEFAKKYNVPIYVRSSFNNHRGTLVSKEVKSMEDITVSGITLNKNEAKITVCDVPDKPGIASKIFRTIAEENINVDMIVQNVSRTGFTDVSFTILKTDLERTLQTAKKIASQIKAGDVLYDKKISKVSAVGIGMKSHSGIAARMFEALASKKINIEMISTSEIKISCIIKDKKAEEAVRVLHKVFNLHRTRRRISDEEY